MKRAALFAFGVVVLLLVVASAWAGSMQRASVGTELSFHITPTVTPVSSGPVQDRDLVLIYFFAGY